MKVLFLCSSVRQNGINPIIKAQAVSLIAQDINIDYFTINKRGIRGYIKALFQLNKYLRNHNENDIIHAHYGLTAIIALLARKKEKLVVSFMGDDLVGSNKPDGSVTKSSILFSRLNRYLARKYYDHSIVKSKEMIERLNKASISLIPNGVNLNSFYPIEKNQARMILGIDQATKLIIFVANPERVEKNYKLVEEAVKLIEVPDTKLKLVFNLNHHQMLYYYNAADILVLSSFHEGSPNVIKEAMACNCPIVSTDVGDVRWIFGDTKGCFIASLDPVDFSKKINDALEFCSEFNRTNGRDRIIELNLDSDSIAKKIISVYNNVTEE